MSERTRLYLKRSATREIVEAALVDFLTTREFALAEKDWQPELDRQVGQWQAKAIPREQWQDHRHWDWRAKDKLHANRWLGIECDGKIQGLMVADLTDRRARLEEQVGRPMVYVQYLALAPWNSLELVSEPQYVWVGRIFVAAAIQLSEAEGFGGRIGLHALRTSETFYKNICGMTDLGPDPQEKNLRYFEMTSKQAAIFLR